MVGALEKKGKEENEKHLYRFLRYHISVLMSIPISSSSLLFKSKYEAVRKPGGILKGGEQLHRCCKTIITVGEHLRRAVMIIFSHFQTFPRTDKFLSMLAISIY